MGTLGKTWKMDRKKDYGFTRCTDCKRLIRKKGSTHVRCKKCRKYKNNHSYGDRENIYREKLTWKFKKPKTISRFTYYRWDKEKKL